MSPYTLCANFYLVQTWYRPFMVKCNALVRSHLIYLAVGSFGPVPCARLRPSRAGAILANRLANPHYLYLYHVPYH